MIPLNAMEERKYQAHNIRWFSLPKQMCAVSKACSAVQVSWNISPGITLSGIGEIATVYVNSCGNTR